MNHTEICPGWVIYEANVSNNAFAFGPGLELILNSAVDATMIVNVKDGDGPQSSSYIPVQVLIALLAEAGYKVTKKEI